MLKKQTSGYCLSTVFSIIVILVLCVTAASAATVNTSFVANRVTLLPVTTATPAYATCPSGYDCMTEADATSQLGSYAKYSDAVCGYKQGTTAGALIRVPQYCIKKVESCPEGCVCITDAMAKQRYGDYTRCSANVCGYQQDQTPKYCIKQGLATPTCPEGCGCISEATAKAKGGSWSRCSADICGYEQSTATLAAVVQVPKYCMKQQETTPLCPDGCSCISESDAKLKGLTIKCDEKENPCGYQGMDTTADFAPTRIPLYCYKMPVATTPTSQVCPQGCYCLQEAEAKQKFGPDNYTRCQADPCGYDPSATTANGIPRYCFKPTVTITPAPAVCPQGCVCTTDEIAKEKGLTSCRGVRTSCGYDEKQQPLYCFEQVPSPTCVYDYQKNVCTGTCEQGYSCGILASEKDSNGKVTYAVCGCTGQPATPCAYDEQKNACTGTCQGGAACSVVGKNVDEKTGATTPVCGCPEQSSCVYDYSKETCAGTCTATGNTCQLNTIYRDPATGKVTYAECHCKGSGDTATTCTCDAASGACTGTCASGKACTMTERTTDNAGKVVCKSCGCTDTCVLDANNRCSGTCPDGGQCMSITSKADNGQEKVSCGCGGQAGTPSGAATNPQGIFEAIGSFFNRLFGGK